MIQISYILLSPVLLVFTYYLSSFFIKYYRNRRLLRDIPSPPQQLLLGNLYVIISNPEKLFERLREFARQYYPIYKLQAFYVTIVSFLDPRDIEIVLSSTKHLSKSKIYTFLYQWLGTGLLTSTGAKWHKRRKILTPAFHFSILQQFVNIFNEETVKLVERLDEESGKVVNVIPHITHYTLQSIGETAMGLNDIDEETQENYREAIYEMGRILFKRLSKPWLRIESVYNWSSLAKQEKKTVKVLHDFSRKIIKEREKETYNSNISDAIASYSKKKRLAMLDLLLETKAKNSDIDHEGIREEVDTFMFEGHDTTAMAISFILLCLANHQEIQNKVADEILRVVGLTKIPTTNDLQELKYTERCIKESLRIFPSVPLISRYAGEEFTTKTGYTIPKGTIIHMHIFDIHRSPKLYPDPLKFDPDRFLPEKISERHPFAYIPFSAGPRNCIGQKFALLELKAVMCGILRRFTLEKVDEMYSIQFKPDLVLRPAQDVRMKLLPRNGTDSSNNFAAANTN